MRNLFIVAALVAGIITPAASALAVTPAPGSAGSAGSAESAGSTGSPEDSIVIRILDAPKDRADDPRARLYIVDHMDLGDSIERRIEVSKTTDETKQVSLYSAGAAIADGSFTGSEGQTQNELSTWTSLDQDTLELEPESSGTVTVTIDVPPDAPPGEQYAVVWAEARAPTPAGGGVTLVNRVGIRLYIDVGAGGESPSDFTIAELTASRLENGQPTVEATVTNTGGRALDMAGSLRLANGPGALSAGPYDAKLSTTLAPGDTELVTIPLDALLPNGPWDATIELHSGLLSRTAQATITFPDSGAASPVAATATDEGGFPLWTVAIAAGLLRLALLAAYAVARRRPRDDTPPPAVPEPEPVGATRG